MKRIQVVMLGLMLAGCSDSADKPAADRGAKDAPAAEGGAAADFTRLPEANPGDLPKLDMCQPGCHWCAKTSDRASTPGRTTWLKCPATAADAGPG